MSAEDIHFCEILMTKCIQRIRDLFEYALYKFTLYLLYLLYFTNNWSRINVPGGAEKYGFKSLDCRRTRCTSRTGSVSSRQQLR